MRPTPCSHPMRQRQRGCSGQPLPARKPGPSRRPSRFSQRSGCGHAISAATPCGTRLSFLRSRNQTWCSGTNPVSSPTLSHYARHGGFGSAQDLKTAVMIRLNSTSTCSGNTASRSARIRRSSASSAGRSTSPVAWYWSASRPRFAWRGMVANFSRCPIKGFEDFSSDECRQFEGRRTPRALIGTAVEADQKPGTPKPVPPAEPTSNR